MINLGTVRPGSTIYIPFESFATTTGAPITITGLATSDVLIYKDGSTTQRASAAGITLLDTDGIDFDAITGIHGFSIDLSDNTTADFYAAGSRYFVVVSTVTVDSQTMSFIAATFDIGYPSATLNTTIATLASQTSFTLAAGPAEDDALNGRWAVIHDAASAVQSTWVQVLDYTGSTKTVTLVAGGTFTVAAKDNFSLMDVQPLMPTVLGRTLDVSAGGEAGVDWANVGSPTTSLALTGTTIATTQKVDIETIKTNPVVNAGTVTFPTTATLASTTNITAGTVTTATNVTTVNGLAAGVITAASIAADAITDAKVAADVTIASVTGAVGSVTGNVGGNVTGSVGSVVGAVGSVTGNVGGNVTGSVGSVAAGGITASSIATDAIDADALAADAVTEIATGVWGFVVQGTRTATKAVRLMLAALTGKASGLGTATAVYRNPGDTIDAITATVDASGNRTAVTLDDSA